MLLSIKDLVWQIEKRKMMKRFVKPYKMNKIISENVVKLKLLESIKIHPVVNIDRILGRN